MQNRKPVIGLTRLARSTAKVDFPLLANPFEALSNAAFRDPTTAAIAPEARMLLHGQCHCGNIAFELDWAGDPAAIPARACGCSFCVKHGGVWTSNPQSRLVVVIGDASLVSKYTFGTRTATFHVCTRCGAVPLVTSEVAKRLYAVVNVNVLDDVDPASLHRATANFDGEDIEARLARRTRNWIADVRIAAARA